MEIECFYWRDKQGLSRGMNGQVGGNGAGGFQPLAISTWPLARPNLEMISGGYAWAKRKAPVARGF
jgi:hypothetical protein